MRKRFLLIPFALLALAGLLAGWMLNNSVQPVDPSGTSRYFHVSPGETQMQILDRAERAGLLKSAAGARLYMRIFGPRNGKVRTGTYELNPALSAQDLMKKLFTSEPVRQLVLIREGLWGSEVKKILVQKSVADEKSFSEVFHHPKVLAREYPFIIYTKDLEGYLFPDTYDLPPLFGAKESIEKMLYAFEKKVYESLGRPDAAKMRKWVIVGSMIELEAKKSPERPKIAGVIYNRLQKGMPLQIDASLFYALKKRRRLFNIDYQNNSPYNTYKIMGLPPGPICSPGADSIAAAAHPSKHKFLYYVALPSGTHLFAETYEQHLHNVALSRKAFSQVRR